MRAETQTLVDRDPCVALAAAEASLTGISAVKRLEELNARAEDPDLWNKRADAQKVMRERTHLENAIEGLSGPRNANSMTR